MAIAKVESVRFGKKHNTLYVRSKSGNVYRYRDVMPNPQELKKLGREVWITGCIHTQYWNKVSPAHSTKGAVCSIGAQS